MAGREWSGAEKSELLWGIICLLGFGLLQFWSPNPFYLTVLALWTFLGIAGILGMIRIMPDWRRDSGFMLGTSVLAVAMVVNWLNFAAGAPLKNAYPYVWFALVAGAYVALTRIHPRQAQIFWAGFLLNAIGGIAYFSGVGFVQESVYLVLAVTVGLPVLLAPFLGKA